MADDPQDGLLLRALSRDGGIAVRAVSAPGLVAEAGKRQGAGPLARAALGRALLGSVLLGAGAKDDETVMLRLRGDGPLGSVLAIADADGRARGRVANPAAERPRVQGALDLAGGIGAGDLSVTRMRPGGRQPYTGVVPIVSGAVAKDLTLYLTESEQTPSAVGLGVQEADGSRPALACGFILQALPGASDTVVARAERNVGRLDSPTDVFVGGGGLRDLVEQLLDGLGVRWLDEGQVSFHCGCTPERALGATALLGRTELEEARREGAPLEVRCDFCGERYAVDPERAIALVDAEGAASGGAPPGP